MAAKKNKPKLELLKKLRNLDKRMLFSVFMDTIFYITMIVILLAGIAIVNSNLETISKIMPILEKNLGSISPEGGLQQPSGDLNIEEIKVANSMMSSVLKNMKIAGWFVGILIIISSMLCRSLIWAKVLKKKISKKYLKQYFMINTGWIACWALVFFVVIRIFNLGVVYYAGGILIVVYLYFTAIQRSLLDENKKPWDIVEEAFRIGAKKIHLVLLKIIPAMVVFALIASFLIYVRNNLGFNFFIMGSVLSFIVYFPWLRIVMANAVSDIEKTLKKKH
jgi:hypothetical protein